MVPTVNARSRKDQASASPNLLGSLLISEFRTRGPNGVADEFIEIYNPTSVDHTVNSVSGTGYALATSSGLIRFVIPNGTQIGKHEHYLIANSGGYSLSNVAAPDGTYTTTIADTVGMALFNNSTGGASFNLANRYDAVGPASESDPLYREGNGYPNIPLTDAEFSLVRRFDPVTGLSQDTGDNAADFVNVDTNGTFASVNPHLGAPGPEASNGPWFFSPAGLPLRAIDSTKAQSVAPNRVRDFTANPGNNSTFGTLSIRRRIVSEYGASVIRLRFRVMDLTTFPRPADAADLRLRSSSLQVASGINDSGTCNGSTPCSISLQGTTLESPTQPKGGGLNSTMNVGTVTAGTPLSNGSSLPLQFLFGVEANGYYHLRFSIETIPGGGEIFEVSGNTNIPSDISDAVNTTADYDRDGKTDISVFRPTTGAWYLLRSQAGLTGVGFGAAGDKIVPADYDGDGRTDVAVYRPSNGVWYVLSSATGAVSYFVFGVAEDLPTPADYDGDGKADLSVFRPSTGTWYRLNSSNGAFISIQFGANGDKPVVGDFDGDSKADLAIFRPSTGVWYRVLSSNNSLRGDQFGAAADLITPEDYDGDGKTDLAVYRPSAGAWYRLNSSNGSFTAVNFGANGDNPTPGDYDGDGKADLSVFRPSDGNWYRLNSSNGAFVAQPFGANGDLPAPAAFRY
jgi:myo-inositol-hexaphosphate 3-phosphohydrolase